MNAQLDTPGSSRLRHLSPGMFPGTERMVYLDAAARGLMSVDTRDAIDAYLDGRVHQGGDKPAMFATLERARARFADLVNASADEVAITKNVSEGLNAVGMALPWSSGDEIVLCSALEHPEQRLPVAPPRAPCRAR